MPRHRAPSRPRHRAPTRRARPIATVALTGMALGGSVLLPLTAMAEPAHDQLSGADHSREASSSDFTDTDSDDSDPGDSSDDGDSDDSSDDRSDHGDSGYSDQSDRADDSARPGRTVAHHPASGAVRRTTHTRPMSSGEEQYRNGCRHGYIVEGCNQYDVPHLLKRGINPFL